MDTLNWLLAPLMQPAFTLFGAPTSWGEIAGFITGALCVYLVARQNIFNWPIGMANNVFFAAIFVSVGLYADAGLQGVYLILAIYGWWAWLHGGAARKQLAVTKTTTMQWAALIAIGIGATALLTHLLATYTPSTVPLADAATTVLSLLATWGMTRKKIESWWLWIAADIIYIPLYHYKGLTLTAILYIGFAALCVIGLIDWKKSMNKDAQAAIEEAGRVQTEAEGPAGAAGLAASGAGIFTDRAAKKTGAP